MVAYINDKYASYISPENQTVSVHFRLGGATEVRPKLFNKMIFPAHNWYQHVMFTEFNPVDVTYLLFADDIDLLRPLVAKMEQDLAPAVLNYHIVDEDFANSLLLMSLTRHHIATASTFSFWGTYLDKKQPYGKGALCDVMCHIIYMMWL
jgi:hypothetical protein